MQMAVQKLLNMITYLNTNKIVSIEEYSVNSVKILFKIQKKKIIIVNNKTLKIKKFMLLAIYINPTIFN